MSDRNAGKQRGGQDAPKKAGRRSKPAGAASPLPLPPPERAAPLFSASEAPADLLEPARTHWQYAAWPELVALDREGLADHPDRAKLALLAAAGQMQIGDLAAARRRAADALAWGTDRTLVARVLAAAVHATLTRAAALLDDDAAATDHARMSVSLVEPKADVALLARTREIRERARVGLLPDAARLLGDDFATVRAAPGAGEARIGMLRAEIEILNHELQLSVLRGQLFRPDLATAGTRPDLAARALSQLGQDLWVLERTNYRTGGYFVDFGATDGVMLSNTWLLETGFGWTGICAEPNPGYLPALRRNRRCIVTDACIAATSGEHVDFVLAGVFGSIADYAEADLQAHSRAPYRAHGNVVRLTTISLEDLLLRHGAPREIDYLSIDTEGSEYDILRAFPFDRWRIRLITVEHNFTPNREAIRTLLEGHGYRRTEARWDDWYALSDP